MDRLENMFTSTALLFEKTICAEEVTKRVCRDGKTKDLRSLPCRDVDGCVCFTERV